MNYSTGCGCDAPAPKPAKTLSVQPLAPTEEIVCPDVRCVPHMLNSLPETDDAVPNYVGVYKGQSYIAPIKALVAATLADAQNAQYRNGEVPTVTEYRDIEAMPVVQKGNCQKTGIAAMPTIAKAMTQALPAAPVGYEPSKVMTTDTEGDVYLATPKQVVYPELVSGLIPAIVENCEGGKIVNIPVLDRILGFGSDCKSFGATTLKQLQEALAKAVPLAAPATLPTFLRGFIDADNERKYPVTVSKQLTSSLSIPVKKSIFAGGAGAPATVTGQTLQPGLYAVTANATFNVTPTGASGVYFGLRGQLDAGQSVSNVTSLTMGTSGNVVFTGVNLTSFVRITTPTAIKVTIEATGQPTTMNLDGDIKIDVMQLAELNLSINGVF